MELLAEKDFLLWAAARGITTYRPEDIESGLIFERDGPNGRFWEFPAGRELPYFFAHALDGLGGWSKLILWPRLGYWPGGYEGAPLGDRVQQVFLHGSGVTGGTSGALVADPSELVHVLGIAHTAATFGWSVRDDVYLIPDRGHALLWIDHHDTLNVYFRDIADVEPFVAHMAAKKYLLPDEPPDETFKKPNWMNGESKGQ